MKRTLAIVLALVIVLSLAACSSKTTQTTETKTETKTETQQTGADSPLAGTYDITVWVGEAAVELTKKQIEDYNNTNELGIKFNATVNGVSEEIGRAHV